MRIISGKNRGKKIIAPKSIKARPTTDFGKESLFNILENLIDFDDLRVLDLFAGTGNISYEFSSRGAGNIVAVDITLASYKFINSFAINNNMPIKAIRNDVFKYLRKGNTGKPYPIVFADPPYHLKNINQLPGLIFDNKWLDEDGLIIIEHGEETDLSTLDYFQETRNYSRVNFSFFKK